MPMLHDDQARARIAERIQGLRPDTQRRWGRMSVDQMLWHLNQALLTSLGQLQTTPMPIRPRFVARTVALNLPWPRGLRTLPEYVAMSHHDFASEHRRHLQMLEDFARRPLAGPWPVHPIIGPITGREWSRVQHKHIDHHLRQFGA